jgi:hypothetical protein
MFSDQRMAEAWNGAWPCAWSWACFEAICEKMSSMILAVRMISRYGIGTAVSATIE